MSRLVLLLGGISLVSFGVGVVLHPRFKAKSSMRGIKRIKCFLKNLSSVSEKRKRPGPLAPGILKSEEGSLNSLLSNE